MGKRKYQRGKVIASLLDLIQEYEAGRGVYLEHKYQAPEWFGHLKLSGLKTLVESGQYRYAKPLFPSGGN